MGRTHRFRAWIVIVGLLAACLLGWERRERSAVAADAPGNADAAAAFRDDVAPLLAKHCVECHGPTKKKAGLDLSSRDAALAGGKDGKVIVPGEADKSPLWEAVDFDEMPADRPPLSAREKKLLRQWIDDGAHWPDGMVIKAMAGPDARVTEAWVQRLTVPEYIDTVRAAVGVDIEREARRLLPPDVRADGFSNTAYNLNVDLSHVEAFARLAQIIVNQMDVQAFTAEHVKREQIEAARKAWPVRDGGKRQGGDEAYAPMRPLIAGVGKWLMRGPLQEHETDAFVDVAKAVAAEGGSFEEALSYIIEGMLQSPRFLYRIEKQTSDGVVSDYELATRLSYILWGAPPDRELMRGADAGELSDRNRLQAQVQRMLDDPRAVGRSLRFIEEWLNLGRLRNLRPNRDRFPNWDSRLADDMRDETLAFFRHIAWEEQRPLADLLNAQVTFVTPWLAEHYGLGRPAVEPAAAEPKLSSQDKPERQQEARVTEGLAALYTFGEGRGDIVRDVSGARDPLNLKIDDEKAVRWNGGGLTVHSPTLIATQEPPRRLIDAVRASRELTLEAWITPDNAKQEGPARIVTLSQNTVNRNFTLGQESDRFDARLRTTGTSDNGIPSLSSASGAAGTQPVHVVYTREKSGDAVIYINGKESAKAKVGGDLSNWDGGYRLAMANELSKDRAWEGTLHLVAVYAKALSRDEVERNHAAGANVDAGKGPAAASRLAPPAPRSGAKLLALYMFDEGGGEVVRDVARAGGDGHSLDLRIADPSAVQWGEGRLTVTGDTLIATPDPARRLTDAVKESNAITIEAWITPADTSLSGPARIVTLSSGSSTRNFTLGQDGGRYDARLRSTAVSTNGIPSVSSSGGAVQTRPSYVVYTRDATGRAKLYLDGEQVGAGNIDGSLSNWDDGFRLALANETTRDRAWQGTYHRVAIYDDALTADEVRSRAGGIGRYDLSGVPGRGGLLTHGSVLTVGGDDASMVTRGLFVLHDLLHGHVDDPPPCVDTTPVPTKPGLSQRAIAEARLANQACGGCHSTFEPFAFGLEKFDGLGAYHEKDKHGNTLREDGEILIPGQSEPIAYKSSAELMDLLAASERVRMTITRKLTQFALGRPLTAADEPAVQAIHEAAQDSGGTYRSLINAIVMSDLVRKRQRGGEPKKPD